MHFESDTLTREAADLFKDRFCCDPDSISSVSGGGGDRKYFRLTAAGISVIAACGPDAVENRTFAELANVFRDAGVNVPEIYAVSPDGHIVLQEDLGDISLFSLIGKGEDVDNLVAETIRNLVRMQTVDPILWKNKVKARPFSHRQIMWDFNYFKYEYAKPGGYSFDEEKLEDDFERLAAILMEISDVRTGFMMRDCQSRNVMIHDGKPYFIDFQDGREGPGLYDAVSFLWQAKAGFSDELRNSAVSLYLKEISGGETPLYFKLLRSVHVFVLFRTLQVLGAYGFRGLVEKKAHFIESIPAALTNLRQLLDLGVLNAFPELKSLCMKAVADTRLNGEALANDGRLHVKVFSFSYKKGYPEDLTGNGGGFMFDCRAMHNPGRYDEYKPLTGLDKPVRDFLEERGEVQQYLANVERLVFPAVERYIKRGFSSLQIGFGCTGGRHRSVYCADTLGRRIAGCFPDAVVEIIHRERGLTTMLNVEC